MNLVIARFVQVQCAADCILVSPREHLVNWKRIPAQPEPPGDGTAIAPA